MKIRSGFVSNSSSSSFVVNKNVLSDYQIEMIMTHSDFCESHLDCWSITDSDNVIKGDCILDNFDMYEYMENIGIDMKYVIWE